MNTIQPRLKPLSALVCDDTRKEISGKDIIIGAYGGDILLGSLPSSITLSLWISLETSGEGEIHTDIRVLNSEGNVLVGLDGSVNLSSRGHYSSLFTPRFRISIDKPTKLRFQFRSGRGRWKTLLTKNVLARESS